MLGVAGQAFRFVFIGAANTAVTGAIFYALAFWIPSSVAYSIAFGIGIVFVVVVTPRFVFRVSPPARRRAAYALWYVLVYLCGLGLVFVLDHVARVGREQVVLLTIATTASLSFLGGRVVLSGSSR